ncbi:MAG: hypothetical protein ACOX2G_09625 [Bacillota bacterium]|jgi:hypothetical protein
MESMERATMIRVTLPPGAVVKYAKMVEVRAPQGTSLIVKVPFAGKAVEGFLDAIRQAGGTVEYI